MTFPDIITSAEEIDKVTTSAGDIETLEEAVAASSDTVVVSEDGSVIEYLDYDNVESFEGESKCTAEFFSLARLDLQIAVHITEAGLDYSSWSYDICLSHTLTYKPDITTLKVAYVKTGDTTSSAVLYEYSDPPTDSAYHAQLGNTDPYDHDNDQWLLGQEFGYDKDTYTFYFNELSFYEGSGHDGISYSDHDHLCPDSECYGADDGGPGMYIKYYLYGYAP